MNAFLLSKNTSNINSSWQCIKCKTEVSAGKITEIEDRCKIKKKLTLNIY